jgi:hypothetical protein
MIVCEHCGNDDKRMLEVFRNVGKKVELLCKVCSKTFVVDNV